KAAFRSYRPRTCHLGIFSSTAFNGLAPRSLLHILGRRLPVVRYCSVFGHQSERLSSPHINSQGRICHGEWPALLAEMESLRNSLSGLYVARTHECIGTFANKAPRSTKCR